MELSKIAILELIEDLTEEYKSEQNMYLKDAHSDNPVWVNSEQLASLKYAQINAMESLKRRIERRFPC